MHCMLLPHLSLLYMILFSSDVNKKKIQIILIVLAFSVIGAFTLSIVNVHQDRMEMDTFYKGYMGRRLMLSERKLLCRNQVSSSAAVDWCLRTRRPRARESTTSGWSRREHSVRRRFGRWSGARPIHRDIATSCASCSNGPFTQMDHLHKTWPLGLTPWELG
jgi:hypothetical protein